MSNVRFLPPRPYWLTDEEPEPGGRGPLRKELPSCRSGHRRFIEYVRIPKGQLTAQQRRLQSHLAVQAASRGGRQPVFARPTPYWEE